MSRRAYNQFCSLARSLDVVGERWTLLLVRELLSGPKRYTDLSEALDGIGSSLLAARLRQLEDDGIVSQRQLPPPAAALVYELTEAGTELGEALLPLALWGARHRNDAPHAHDTYRAEWALVFIARLVDSEAIGAASYTYRCRLGVSTAYLQVDAKGASVTAGPLDQVDATVVTEPATIVEISAGRLSMSEAIASGHVALEGDQDALLALVRMLPERIPARPRIMTE